MADKLLLGKVSENYGDSVRGEHIYLSKHSWDCDWYWGFGYVGNKNLHTHFNSEFLSQETDVNKIFLSTNITAKAWWVIRDLFIQAYALKKCAAVYRHGGYQTTEKGVTDIIRDKEMEDRLNKDLEIVLNKLWEYLEEELA